MRNLIVIISLVILPSCRNEYKDVVIEVVYIYGDIDTIHIEKVISYGDIDNSFNFSNGCLSYQFKKNCIGKCSKKIACSVRKYRLL